MNGFESKLLKEGRKDGRVGLAPQTVKHCHRLLKQALEQAAKRQLINRNPADAIETPRVTKMALKVLDADQTMALLEALQPTSLYIPTLIAVMNSLRRGETLALRWKNLDFDSGNMSVLQSLGQT